MFMQEENMDRDENPYLWFIAFWDYVWWMLILQRRYDTDWWIDMVMMMFVWQARYREILGFELDGMQLCDIWDYWRDELSFEELFTKL